MPINGKSKKRDQPNSIFANTSVLIATKINQATTTATKLIYKETKAKHKNKNL